MCCGTERYVTRIPITIQSCVLTVFFFLGEQEIEGLTDKTIPRRLGPKRANKIRKLFNLTKEDDVRQYVVRRPLAEKEGKKPQTKAPKIQRLITPQRLQRKRRLMALKRQRSVKRRELAADYARMLAERQKEQRLKRAEEIRRRRSSASSGGTRTSISKPLKAKPVAAPKTLTKPTKSGVAPKTAVPAQKKAVPIVKKPTPASAPKSKTAAPSKQPAKAKPTPTSAKSKDTTKKTQAGTKLAQKGTDKVPPKQLAKSGKLPTKAPEKSAAKTTAKAPVKAATG